MRPARCARPVGRNRSFMQVRKWAVCRPRSVRRCTRRVPGRRPRCRGPAAGWPAQFGCPTGRAGIGASVSAAAASRRRPSARPRVPSTPPAAAGCARMAPGGAIQQVAVVGIQPITIRCPQHHCTVHPVMDFWSNRAMTREVGGLSLSWYADSRVAGTASSPRYTAITCSRILIRCCPASSTARRAWAKY